MTYISTSGIEVEVVVVNDLYITSGIETEAEPHSPIFLSLPLERQTFRGRQSARERPPPPYDENVTPGRNGERINFRGQGRAGAAPPLRGPRLRRGGRNPSPSSDPTLVVDSVVAVSRSSFHFRFLPRLLLRRNSVRGLGLVSRGCLGTRKKCQNEKNKSIQMNEKKMLKYKYTNVMEKKTIQVIFYIFSFLCVYRPRLHIVVFFTPHCFTSQHTKKTKGEQSQR